MEAERSRGTRTKVVRMLAEDVERAARLSGLPPGMPFSAKMNALLDRLEPDPQNVKLLREILREELERAVGYAS